MLLVGKSGLVNHVVKNPCQRGQLPQKTAALKVEGLVGAVYLDCGKDISTSKKVLEALTFYPKA